LLAFAAIYFLWGGTFLAIRVAVLALPPFFTAGSRFFVAGSLLYGFLRLRGERSPSGTEWGNLVLIGLLMFVLTYGPLFLGCAVRDVQHDGGARGHAAHYHHRV
jgi:drug/metabolite transporter (DMT)-like permease